MREDLRFLKSQSGAVWLHEPHGKLHYWHHHDELEFNLVAKGTARYLLDDRRYDLGPGCLVWLFPDQEHLLVDLSPDFAAWMGVITPESLRAACAGAHKDLRSGDPPGNFCRRLVATDTAFLGQLCRDLLPPLPVRTPRASPPGWATSSSRRGRASRPPPTPSSAPRPIPRWSARRARSSAARSPSRPSLARRG